jgi:hypothetical protein
MASSRKRIALRLLIAADQAVKSIQPPIAMGSVVPKDSRFAQTMHSMDAEARWGAGPFNQLLGDFIESVAFKSPSEVLRAKGGGSKCAGFAKALAENVGGLGLTAGFIYLMTSQKVMIVSGEAPLHVYQDMIAKGIIANVFFQGSRGVVSLFTDKCVAPIAQLNVTLNGFQVHVLQPFFRGLGMTMGTEFYRQAFVKNGSSIGDLQNTVAFDLVAAPVLQAYELGVGEVHKKHAELEQKSLDTSKHYPAAQEDIEAGNQQALEPLLQQPAPRVSGCTIITLSLYYTTLLVTGFSGVLSFASKQNAGTATAFDATVEAGGGSHLFLEGVRGLFSVVKAVNRRSEESRDVTAVNRSTP